MTIKKNHTTPAIKIIVRRVVTQTPGSTVTNDATQVTDPSSKLSLITPAFDTTDRNNNASHSASRINHVLFPTGNDPTSNSEISSGSSGNGMNASNSSSSSTSSNATSTPSVNWGNTSNSSSSSTSRNATSTPSVNGGNTVPVNCGNATPTPSVPGNVAATQSVSMIPGLRAHNNKSSTPSGCSTISLQDLMK